MLRTLPCCGLALLAACTAPGPRLASLPTEELLAGTALGVPQEAGVPLAGEAVFELDDTMRAFVAEHTGGVGDHAAKLRRLLAGMRDRGFFSLVYDETVTRPARNTFYERQGNCLSFTILFVALAREAGLDVTYQVVDMPPSWSRESDLVLVTNHVNALVETRSGQYVVDFNIAGYRVDRPQQPVDDAHVLGLFYNNLGVEALIREDYVTSFRYLRGALAVAPDVTDPWVNLGVLYRRQGHMELAEAAYSQVLAVKPRDGSALSNLVNLELLRGNQVAADAYRELIRRYQQRNPYYHFFVAREAFEQQRFADAESALTQALRRKRDEPAFHELSARLARARSGETTVVNGEQHVIDSPSPDRFADAALEQVSEPPSN